MDPESVLEAVLDTLEELKDEDGVSRLLHDRIEEMEETLREDIALELRVDRVRGILDDIDSDTSIQNHIRTRLWSVAASLELL